MKLKLSIIIAVFLLGLYFMCRPDVIEGFDNKNHSCPNILIQKGSQFYLYNSKQANVPGVNPITFDNLEDYTEFLDWQRSQGIRCPVLFLQESYDAQGNAVYNARPSPDNLQGGLLSIPPGGQVVILLQNYLMQDEMTLLIIRIATQHMTNKINT